MRIRPRHVVGAFALSAALLVGTVGCSSAAPPASPSATSKDPLAAAKAFYKGKTITFIVGNAAGSGPATAMSLLKEPMEKYLGATINMTFSTAAPIASEDQVGTAPADGLTIGELSLGAALLAVYSGAGTPSFDLRKASFMGSVVQVPDMLVACTNSPIKSLDDLTSGKYPVKMVSQKLGQNGLVANYLLNVLGVSDPTWSFYSNTADQTTGCTRGDGNLNVGNVVNSTDASGTKMTPGITPLMVLGDTTGFPSESTLKKVTTLDKWAAAHQPKTAKGKQALKLIQAMFTDKSPSWVVFGPPGMNDGYRQFIADAMKSAMADPAVQAKFTAATTPTQYVTPEEVKASIDKQLGDNTSIIKGFLP